MLLVCILPYSSFVFYHNPHFHFTIFVISILPYSSFVFYHIPHLYFTSSFPFYRIPHLYFTIFVICILPYSSFVFYHNPHFHFTIFVICILTYSSFVFYHIPHLYFNIFLICILPYSSFVFYHILHLYFTIFLICILPYSSFVFYHIRHLYSTIFLICNSTYSSFVFYHIPHFHIPSHPLLTLPFSMLFIQCRSCSHSGPAGTAGETWSSSILRRILLMQTAARPTTMERTGKLLWVRLAALSLFCFTLVGWSWVASLRLDLFSTGCLRFFYAPLRLQGWKSETHTWYLVRPFEHRPHGATLRRAAKASSFEPAAFVVAALHFEETYITLSARYRLCNTLQQ